MTEKQKPTDKGETPPPTVEGVRLELEEILRAHQAELQEFVNLVFQQYDHIDTETYTIMLGLSVTALHHKAQIGQVLEKVKNVSMLRLVS